MGIEQQMSALETQVGQLRESAGKFFPGSESKTIGEIADDLAGLEISLESMSWYALKEISDDQSITADYLSGYVGQSKKITVNGYGEYDLICIGVRHDDKSDGSGKAGFTFQLSKLAGEGFSSNTWTSTDNFYDIGGEEDPDSILAAMPAEFRSCVCKVNKTYNTPSKTVKKISRSAWTISQKELVGYSNYVSEEKQYDYWSKHESNVDRIKFDNTYDNLTWSLRDLFNTTNKMRVNYDGSIESIENYYITYSAPCFCI